MLYGDEKLREMARSILPSSRRTSAQNDLAHCKRANRRKMNMNLRRVLFDPDFEFEDDVDPREYPDREIKMIVERRRDGDKVSHFQRWAVAHTSELEGDPAARFAKVRAVLPNNLIGWHACTHIAYMDEFRTQQWRNFWYLGSRTKKPLTREQKVWFLNRTLEDSKLIMDLNNWIEINTQTTIWVSSYLEPELHTKVHTSIWAGKVYTREISHWEMKSVYEDKTPKARTLRCPHDVEAFLDDIEAARKTPSRVNKREAWIEQKLIPTKDNKSYQIQKIKRYGHRNPNYQPKWSEALDNHLNDMRNKYNI